MERLGYKNGIPPASQALWPLRSALNVAIFFIYLLIIYPACPRGQSGGPTCTGRRFSFAGRRRILGILHEKTVVPLGKMFFQRLAPRLQSVYNTDSAGHPPAAVRPGRADAGRPAGRGHSGPLIAKRSTE